MRAVWSGTIPSASRLDRATGLPVEYRLVAYDDGQASCSCPDFLYAGARNPQRDPSERLRYRCKHLAPLFKGGAFAPPVAHAPAVATSGGPSAGDPGPSPTAGAARETDDTDDDDDEDYRPARIRR